MFNFDYAKKLRLFNAINLAFYKRGHPLHQKKVKMGHLFKLPKQNSSGPKVDGAAGYKIYWSRTLPHLLWHKQITWDVKQL